MNQIRLLALCFLVSGLLFLVESCVQLPSCSRYLQNSIQPLELDSVLVFRTFLSGERQTPLIEVQIEGSENLEYIMLFSSEISGIHSYLQKGDILYKRSGSLIVKVDRYGKIQNFELACKY